MPNLQKTAEIYVDRELAGKNLAKCVTTKNVVPRAATHGNRRIGFGSILCYNLHMDQKPLIETNPYLRDPVRFRKALIRSVASSTAIETGAPVGSIARMLGEDQKTAPLTNQKGSAR